MDFSLKSVLEALVVGAVTTLIAAVVFHIPILNLVLLIWPTPFVLVGLRRGMGAGVLAVLAAGGILSIFDPQLGLLAIIFNIFLVFFLTWALQKKMGIFEDVIISSAGGLLAVLLSVRVLSWMVGQNILDFYWEQIRAFFTQGPIDFDRILNLYLKQGLISEPITPAQLAELIIDQMKLVVPASFMVFSLVLGGLNFLTVRWIGNPLGLAVPYVPPFREWALPRGTGRGLMLILLFSMIGSSLRWSNFEFVYVAIYMLFTVVFALQGLALGAFFLKVARVPKVLRVLILLIAAVFMQIVAFAGVAEQIFQIRKVYKNRTRWV